MAGGMTGTEAVAESCILIHRLRGMEEKSWASHGHLKPQSPPVDVLLPTWPRLLQQGHTSWSSSNSTAPPQVTKHLNTWAYGTILIQTTTFTIALWSLRNMSYFLGFRFLVVLFLENGVIESRLLSASTLKWFFFMQKNNYLLLVNLLKLNIPCALLIFCVK